MMGSWRRPLCPATAANKGLIHRIGLRALEIFNLPLETVVSHSYGHIHICHPSAPV